MPKILVLTANSTMAPADLEILIQRKFESCDDRLFYLECQDEGLTPSRCSSLHPLRRSNICFQPIHLRRIPNSRYGSSTEKEESLWRASSTTW
jgi:hypothetical protein